MGNRRLIDREEVRGMFGDDNDRAAAEFIKFMHETNTCECLDVKEKKNRITDDKAKGMIEEILKIKPAMIRNEPQDKKEERLKEILKIEGISTRQLARITGVLANFVWRVSKRKPRQTYAWQDRLFFKGNLIITFIR